MTGETTTDASGVLYRDLADGDLVEVTMLRGATVDPDGPMEEYLDVFTATFRRKPGALWIEPVSALTARGDHREGRYKVYPHDAAVLAH